MRQFFTPLPPVSPAVPPKESTGAGAGSPAAEPPPPPEQSTSPTQSTPGGPQPLAPPATVLALLDSIEVALDAIRGAENNLKHARSLLHMARSEVVISVANTRPAALDLSHIVTDTDTSASSLSGEQSHDPQRFDRTILTQADPPVSPTVSFRSSFSQASQPLSPGLVLHKPDNQVASPQGISSAPEGNNAQQLRRPVSDANSEQRPSSYASGLQSVWNAVFSGSGSDLPTLDSQLSAQSAGQITSTADSSTMAVIGHANAAFISKAAQQQEKDSGHTPEQGEPRIGASPTDFIQRFYSPRLVDARDSLVKVPTQENLGPALLDFHPPSASAPNTLRDKPALLPRQSSPDLRSASAGAATQHPPNSGLHNQVLQTPTRAGSMSLMSKASHANKWWSKTVEKIAPRRIGSRECLVQPQSTAAGGGVGSSVSVSSTAKSSYKDLSVDTTSLLRQHPLLKEAVEERPAEEEEDRELGGASAVHLTPPQKLLSVSPSSPSSSSQTTPTARTPHPWALQSSTPSKIKTTSSSSSGEPSDATAIRSAMPFPSDEQPQQKADSLAAAAAGEERARTSYEFRRDIYRQSAFFGSVADYAMSPSSVAADQLEHYAHGLGGAVGESQSTEQQQQRWRLLQQHQLDMISPTLPLTDLVPEGGRKSRKRRDEEGDDEIELEEEEGEGGADEEGSDGLEDEMRARTPTITFTATANSASRVRPSFDSWNDWRERERDVVSGAAQERSDTPTLPSAPAPASAGLSLTSSTPTAAAEAAAAVQEQSAATTKRVSLPRRTDHFGYAPEDEDGEGDERASEAHRRAAGVQSGADGVDASYSDVLQLFMHGHGHGQRHGPGSGGTPFRSSSSSSSSSSFQPRSKKASDTSLVNPTHHDQPHRRRWGSSNTFSSLGAGTAGTTPGLPSSGSGRRAGGGGRSNVNTFGGSHSPSRLAYRRDTHRASGSGSEYSMDSGAGAGRAHETSASSTTSHRSMLRSVASEDSLYDDNAHHDADGRSSFYSQRTGHSTTTSSTSSSGAAEVASSIRTWSRATSSPRSGWSARERASGSSTPTRPSTAQDLALLTPPGGVVRALSSSSSAAAAAGVSAFGRGGAGSTAAQPSPATPFKTLFQSHHQHTHTHTSAVRVSSPGGTRSTATADDDDGDDDIVEDDEDGQEDGMIATQAPPGSATLSPPARGHAHAHAGPLRLDSADLAFTGDYSFSSISSSSSTNHHHPANHTEFSPLPKWENRKEVSDWIERKTRERGLLHGAQGTPGVGVGVGAGASVGSGGEQQLCAEWWTRDVDELAAGGQGGGGSGSGSGHQAQAMLW